jgi:hypothetical protein
MSQSQNPEVIALSRRLELLGQISGDALASVAADVELRIENLAGAGVIDATQAVMLKNAGVDNRKFAEQQAIKRAAENEIAATDKETLVIARVMWGSEPITLAAKLREIRKLNSAAAAKAGR